MNLNPPGDKSTFDIALAVAGGDSISKITAKGSVTPASKKSWRLKGTSGDIVVKINKLDMESLTPAFALVGKDIHAGGKLDADIDVRIDDGQFEKLSANVVLSDLKKKIAGKETTLTEPVKIDIDLSSDEEKVVIDSFKVSSSFCSVDCRGRIDSLDYVAEADLKELQEFTGQFVDFGDYKLTGELSSAGKVSFAKGIKATSESNIKNFIVSRNNAAAPKTSVKLSFDIETDTNREILKINSAMLSAEPGEIQIKNSVVPLDGESEEKLSLAIEAEIDLAKAQPFAEMFVDIEEGIRLGGTVTSELSVSRERNRYRIVTDKTNIQNLLISKSGEKPFEDEQVKLTLDVVLDFEEKTYEINELLIDGSKIDVTGNISSNTGNGKTKIEAELQAQYDLAAVSSAASAFVPQGFSMRGKRKDRIKLNSKYPEGQTDKFLANLNGEAQFGFDGAEYMGLSFGPVETKINIKQGLLTIAPFSTTVNDGTLRFSGSADFKQKPVLLKTPEPMRIIENVNINDETSRRLLKYLNPIFANAVNVHGVADFHCEKLSIQLTEATINDLEITGTIGIDQMRLEASDLLGQIISLAGARQRQTDLTLMPTRFVLKNGLLSYDDMQINIGDNPVNFSGSIGLDKSLDMKVTLPYTFGGKTVRTGQTAADRISLSLEGNLDRPRINTGKLLESEVQKLIEQETQKLLEKLLK